MHAPRTTIVVALLATLATAASARAGTGFAGNVCSLLTAKQVTTIQGVAPKCTRSKPMQGPGSTIYVATWNGTTPRSPHLQVTVSRYTDQGALQLAKRNLDQGLPGAARKVAGIGSAAYEATGAGSTAVHFGVGKYIVVVIVNTTGKLPSTRSVEALARAIAPRL